MSTWDLHKLVQEGWSLRHIIQVGSHYIALETENLAPISDWVAVYYFDVTSVLSELYRPEVGMREYCLVKAWPKPASILGKDGQVMIVRTEPDLKIYFRVSLSGSTPVVPQLVYGERGIPRQKADKFTNWLFPR